MEFHGYITWAEEDTRAAEYLSFGKRVDIDPSGAIQIETGDGSTYYWHPEEENPNGYGGCTLHGSAEGLEPDCTFVISQLPSSGKIAGIIHRSEYGLGVGDDPDPEAGAWEADEEEPGG